MTTLIDSVVMKLNEEELTDEQKLLVSCYKISHQCDDSNSDIENVLDVEVGFRGLADVRTPSLRPLSSLRVRRPWRRSHALVIHSTCFCVLPASFSNTPCSIWTTS